MMRTKAWLGVVAVALAEMYDSAVGAVTTVRESGDRSGVAGSASAPHLGERVTNDRRRGGADRGRRVSRPCRCRRPATRWTIRRSGSHPTEPGAVARHRQQQARRVGDLQPRRIAATTTQRRGQLLGQRRRPPEHERRGRDARHRRGHPPWHPVLRESIRRLGCSVDHGRHRRGFQRRRPVHVPERGQRQALRDQHHPARAGSASTRWATPTATAWWTYRSSRDFEIGSEAEGCVADDATGALLRQRGRRRAVEIRRRTDRRRSSRRHRPPDRRRRSPRSGHRRRHARESAGRRRLRHGVGAERRRSEQLLLRRVRAARRRMRS